MQRRSSPIRIPVHYNVSVEPIEIPEFLAKRFQERNGCINRAARRRLRRFVDSQQCHSPTGLKAPACLQWSAVRLPSFDESIKRQRGAIQFLSRQVS